MRNSGNTSDDRQFSRNEWLTKTQIKGFFSRLAAKQRKQHGLLAGFSSDNEEDVECLLEDTERRGLVNEINDEIGLKHPITYDMYDICDYYHQAKLSTFNVPMLKRILTQLEIPYKSKDKKAELISKLKKMVSECECSEESEYFLVIYLYIHHHLSHYHHYHIYLSSFYYFLFLLLCVYLTQAFY